MYNIFSDIFYAIPIGIYLPMINTRQHFLYDNKLSIIRNKTKYCFVIQTDIFIRFPDRLFDSRKSDLHIIVSSTKQSLQMFSKFL